jgi:hypothetical protein
LRCSLAGFAFVTDLFRPVPAHVGACCREILLDARETCAGDALRRADLYDVIAKRRELARQRQSDERTEVHARLERMPLRSLMCRCRRSTRRPCR